MRVCKSKKILLSNAYAAWMDAIESCVLIKDGVSTLLYKKRFVSSLHNSVELFLKQIMLDRCDYRVATVKDCAATGQPLKSFFESNDLNAYFQNIASEDRKKFLSIDFSKLIDIFGKQEEVGHKTELGILKKLRNDETHFYIHSSEYLKETEFKQLYNFMIDFSDYIQKKRLMPWAINSRTGARPAELLFRVEPITNFCYSSAIKSSKVSKILSQVVSEKDIIFLRSYGIENTQDFAFAVWKYMKEEVGSFKILCAYIESLFAAEAISYIEYEQNIEDEGDEYIYSVAKIKTIE